MKYKFNPYKIILPIGVLIPFVLLLILICGYFFVVPRVVDLDKYTSEIRTLLYKRTTYPLELGKLHIDLTWNFRARVSANKISIKKPDSSQFIDLGKSYLEVSLPDLVSNKVVIKKISINNLNADVTRKENGKFDVQDIFKPGEKSKYSVSLRKTDIIVREYNLSFTDKYFKPSKRVLFEGKRIKINDFSPNKYIEMHAVGKMVPENRIVSNFDTSLAIDLPVKKGKKLRLKGSITNLEPNYFISYINAFSRTSVFSIAKKINIVYDLELDKGLFGKNHFFISSGVSDLRVSTLRHGIISEHTGTIKIMGRGYYDNKSIRFNDFKAFGEGIDFKCQGSVKNYKSPPKNRVLNLDMVFANSNVEEMARIFPKHLRLKRNYAGNILKHNISGIINGSLALKGPGNAPNMFGGLLYSNLVVSKIPLKSEGRIDFAGNTLFLNNRVFTDQSGLTTVIGSIVPFNRKTVSLNIDSNSIDLQKALNCMLVLRDFFNIKMGPVYDMSFKGNGRIKLFVHGPFRNTNIDGDIVVKDVTVKYAELSKPAEHVEGKLVFKDGKAIYDELIGYTEGSKITATGYTSLKGYSDVIITIPQIELARGFEIVGTSPLLVQTKEALKAVLKVNGKSDMKIHLVGTEEDLVSDGEFVFENVNMLYDGFGEEFKQMKGRLRYKDEDVYFDKITGKAAGSTVTMSGFIKKNMDTEMELVSDALNFNEAQSFVMKSPILIDVIRVLKDYTDLKGTSPAKIKLKGNLDKYPFQSMVLSNVNGTFNHKLTGIPITLNGGSLNIEVDRVIADKVTGSSGGINFIVSGNVSNTAAFAMKRDPLVPNFELTTDKFELAKIKTFSRLTSMPAYQKKLLSEIDNLRGYASVSMKLTPKSITARISPENISCFYSPCNSSLLIKNGKIEIADDHIELTTLNGVLSGSPFNLNGFVRDIKGKPIFDVTANIDVKANDLDKLRKYFNIPVYAGGEIPLSLIVKGNADDWGAYGRIVLERGSYLNYMADMGLPRDKVRLVTLNARGNRNIMNVENLRIDVSDMVAMQAKAPSNQTNEGFTNLINIHGVINGLTSSKPYYQDFIIETNNENSIGKKFFNTSTISGAINEKGSLLSGGDFKAGLTLNGYVANPDINGTVSLNDIAMPKYKAHIDAVNILFNKKSITSNITNLKIGESIVNVSATTNTASKVPLLIDDLRINARMINVDELVKIFSATPTGGKIVFPPLAISRGSLTADEIIIRNLITTNASGSFNLTPDWLLSVSELGFQAGNGNGKANMNYNFKTNELSSNINVENMQANALATTLLNLPNEVYGTLSGSAWFSTQGKTPQELISNANGYTEFHATQGQFVRLGSLEYLLRASNVIQSGVGGFNINNIIDLIAPKKTGHYETLRGKVYAKNGVLTTDDLTTSGNNLSLFISGNLDMLTNNANIQVLGRLPRKITGLLGPVGSITINQFIDYIPGLGFLPTTPDRKGVLDLIPGLSKIPGLELSNDEEFRRFAVQINGNLYKQESVKSFRWIE